MLLPLILFLFLIFRPPVLAAGEFNLTQNISYSLSSSGTANVSQEINLTNNISEIYAKEYQISISNSNLQNLKAHDKSGDILRSVSTTPTSSTIFLKFSHPVIGKDQVNQFFLDYSIPNFAQKKGNTWELQFPTFDDSQDNQQINISLDVPESFGDLSFSSIPTTNIHTINNRTQIQFNQNQAKNKVLLIFGNHQLFDFKLNYYLQNQQSKDITTEIPLPPDTSRQTIIFKDINPLPQKIRVDPDGNWLAQYILKPSQSIEITATGQAKIHPPQLSSSTPPTSDLTHPQQYWPSDDPQITAISQNIHTPKQIYQYVVSTLNYNYQGIETAVRQGALAALTNPNNALCTEFTDLFIALSRANHIPAREIEGFAYSNNSKIKPLNLNSDILHAWPEYYDDNKKTWIQVDPTWEKTTNGIDYFSDLDLNHLAFVIHGQDSRNPPPPGSYKKDQFTKSVFVDFATNYIETKYNPPTLAITDDKLTIFNPNLYSLSTFQIKLNQLDWSQQISSMPPLSSIELTLPQISFFHSLSPQFQKYNFTITPEGSSPISTQIIYKQHYLNLIIVFGVTIFILCLGGIILTASKKSNEKNS